MYDLTLKQGATDKRPALWLDRHIPDELHEFGREAVGFGAIEHPIFLSRNDRLVSVAEPSSGFDQGVQDCLQVESRTADHLEHIGGCGLLLQRLPPPGGAGGGFSWGARPRCRNSCPPPF